MAAVTALPPNTMTSANSKYYMTTSAGISPPEVGLGRTGSAYASPTSQSPSSGNISPTNLHSRVNIRQLRQPRQPLYIPAALRPTEPSSRPTDIPSRPRAPDTPPSSKDNSYDSGRSSQHSSPSLQFSASTFDSPSPEDDLSLLRRGLSRAASEGLDEELGDVTGPPTTAHWKPDASADQCAVCQQGFTWFFRRHHCRRCGDVVCDSHVTKRVPLDQNARYHPAGAESKACDLCWQEWKVIKKIRHSRANSIAESSNSSNGTVTGQPAMPIPRNMKPSDEARVGSMARSEGMVWSTF